MIVLDTETTGLLLPSCASADEQPRIIDFAAVKVDRRTGRETARLSLLIHPSCTLPSEITKITGYTDKDLAQAPRFAACARTITNFFLGERCMLAHNMPFDKGMLYWELVRIGLETSFPWPPQQLCTVQMYAEEFFGHAGGRGPKLITLYETKLGRKLEQKHTAMADVEALLEIVRQERLYELEDI